MKTLFKLTCIALLVWIGVSFIEVASKNLDTNPTYSDCNFFGLFMSDRMEYGTYHDDGTVITDDGHIWGYDADFEDGTRVRVYFDDCKTDDITDDVITRLSVSK